MGMGFTPSGEPERAIRSRSRVVAISVAETVLSLRGDLDRIGLDHDIADGDDVSALVDHDAGASRLGPGGVASASEWPSS